jgi:3-hydroxyisobutyrate dehydrogenase-like beta-hydroxyacid dehydrogenase
MRQWGLSASAAPMAANLAKAGFALTIFDIPESVVRYREHMSAITL